MLLVVAGALAAAGLLAVFVILPLVRPSDTPGPAEAAVAAAPAPAEPPLLEEEHLVIPREIGRAHV